MEREKMFKISQEDRQKLLNYLKGRPYEEVFTLIALVVGLKPVENSKDKDREDWKETKGINKIPKPIKKDN